MGRLSNSGIRVARRQGLLEIEPFSEAGLKPSSYDVLLGKSIGVFDVERVPFIDPRQRYEGLTHSVDIAKAPFYLQPGQFVLADTREVVTLSPSVSGVISGKSSLGRIGLIIEIAGYIDPGFSGTLTLELKNIFPIPVRLHPSMPFAQIIFDLLDSPADPAYGHPDLNSKYQGQRGPTESRYWQNFDGS